MFRAKTSTLALLAGLCLTSASLSAATPQVPAPGKAGIFPTAGIDQVDHEITIDLFQRSTTGVADKLLETLTFRGRMVLERGDAYVNSTGFREIAFVVNRWEATAWSKALSSMVVYRLNESTQPTSYITAETTTADFPATFDFNLNFEASAFGMILLPRHHGRPKGHGFMEVPPTGNRPTSPTLTSFETALITAEHPTLGTIYFKPRHCNDQGGTTLATYSVAEKANLKLPGGQ
jgi:hypothetical protein